MNVIDWTLRAIFIAVLALFFHTCWLDYSFSRDWERRKKERDRRWFKTLDSWEDKSEEKA